MSRSFSAGWHAYREAFRADAHQLLAWGYSDVRSLLGTDSEETEITGLIVHAIELRLDDERTPERFEHYEVTEDSPLQGEGRSGKRRRRADIRIKSRFLKPRPRYVFEAKRLKKTSHGVSGYLGTDGLHRFLGNTSYAAEAVEAAMLAYVQSPTVDSWIADLTKSLSGADPALGIVNPLTPVASSCFDHLFTTVHRRSNGEELEICHIFLDCT